MIWFVLLILAIIAAYFIYQGLRARHIERCQHDNRTSEHVPESVSESNAQQNGDATAFDNQDRNTQTNLSEQPVPAPHDSPSLLYADRNNDAAEDESKFENATGHGESFREEKSDQLSSADSSNSDSSSADTMDLTAETATLSSDEVGMPANNSEYDRKIETETVVSPTQNHDSVVSRETAAANAPDVHSHEYQSTRTTSVNTNQVSTSEVNSNDVNTSEYQSDRVPDTRTTEYQAAHDAQYNHAHQTLKADQSSQNVRQSDNTSSNPGAIAAGIAGVAGVAAVASRHQNNQNQNNQHSSQQDNRTQYSATTNQSNDGIDLELGDSTHNDGDDLGDDNDELLDFGDLTADISEMLKELNLRESDSPRLEINEKEYQQLKTGDPGEVKPEKIENVAGKLRDMLQ